MKSSKKPLKVPTYGPNDHLGHAANAKHEADWCVRNGYLDKAWGLYHEQQDRYSKHAVAGSGFTREGATALISSINESFANILRLEARHKEALAHLIYSIAGTRRPTKSQLKKLSAYFKRVKLSRTTLDDVNRLISQQRPLADFAQVAARVAKWE